MPSELDQLDAPFRELFELSPDAILVFVGGLVTHANPAALRLLRASSHLDLIGRASRDLIDPEFLPDVEVRARLLMNGTTKSSRAEERYIRLDGTRVDVETTAARATSFEGMAFIVILRDIADRREADERLVREREAAARTAAAEERERWLRELIDLLPLVVFARDERGAFILVNRTCREFFGGSEEDLLGKTLADLGYGDATAALTQEDEEILRTGKSQVLAERQLRDGNGRMRSYSGVKVLLRRGDGQAAVLGALNDLTDRRELEEQLLHAQKMEGIGRLAGGVAHEFNNLLTVILESADHLASTVPDPEGDLPRVRDAATRAAQLTQQLLAFAHRAPARPRITSIDELVVRMARLLGRVLGEDVKLEVDVRAPDARALVDAGQLDVVIMSVAVNARDAMPSGGTLVLATRVSRERLRGDPSPIAAIVLEMRDTGTGMDEATRKRAFEPFFTTKQVGVGTGLGLSTSYGIVEQFGGRMEIESAPGSGTTVRVILPVCSPVADAPAPPSEHAARTVLLLEDEPAVRRATTRMLRSLGYVVLDCGRPSEALTVARTHAGTIDVLLTDVVMPEMNGVEAAKQFRALRADAAVLFVSGYSRDALAQGPGEAPLRHLGKPFTKSELAEALHEAIAAHAASP